MNENTNEEVKQEVATTEVKPEETKTEETKEQPKEKPKKETKAEKKAREKLEREKLEYKAELPPEEKKPKEPIPKEDIIWYVLAVVCVILAILPFMLRLWDPSYDKEAYEARKKGGKTGDSDAELVELNCQKTFNETEYSYTVYVNSSYEDGIIQKSEITYKVTISGTSSLNVSDIRIPEYTTLSNEQSAGVSSSVTSDSYKVIIDYTADEALRSDNNFGYHNKNLDDQRVNYTSNGYNCT